MSKNILEKANELLDTVHEQYKHNKDQAVFLRGQMAAIRCARDTIILPFMKEMHEQVTTERKFADDLHETIRKYEDGDSDMSAEHFNTAIEDLACFELED